MMHTPARPPVHRLKSLMALALVVVGLILGHFFIAPVLQGAQSL